MCSLAYPNFRPFFCFVHLHRILNNLQYTDFDFPSSYDTQKAVMDALDWCA